MVEKPDKIGEGQVCLILIANHDQRCCSELVLKVDQFL